MHFDADSVWKANNRGFSMGVASKPGRLVHLTGQVAWNEQEQIVGVNDVTIQTRQILENIRALLSRVGGRMEDIVSITTWYTAPDQLQLIQKVRNEFFERAQEPASTSVMVAGLGHKEFLVEMTPVAVIPDNRFKDEHGT